MDDPLDKPWLAPFKPEADEADILACFRLLLGRRPNPEEWPGHSARAGEPLPGVVSSYVNSLEFARRGLTTLDGAVPAVAEHHGFRMYASGADPAVGRHVLAGTYKPEVAAVFREVLRPGMGAVDVGAGIGFFTMLAASLVGPTGAVLAVEPNPRNARMLEASRRMNGYGHVTVMQVAAGPSAGLLESGSSLTSGTTPATDHRPGLEADLVACLALDSIVPRTPQVGLLKLHAEVAGYGALLGCQALLERDRPVIVMEYKPGALAGSPGVSGGALLRWLAGQGYSLEVVELDGPPAPMGQDPAAVERAYDERGNSHIHVVARPTPRGLDRLPLDRP